MHPVRILGTEIGSHALSEASAARIGRADMLVGGAALLERWSTLCPSAELLSLGGPQAVPLSQILERIKDAWQANLRVVVLADGDPLYFGIGASLARALPAKALRFAPGLSSLQCACARLGLVWPLVPSVSLHGRDDWRRLAVAFAVGCASGSPVCVLGDVSHGPRAVAEWLQERGALCRLHVFTDLNTGAEAHQEYSLDEATRLNVDPPAPTMLLFPDEQPRPDRLDSHLPQTDGELLTKLPVRAAAVAQLRLRPESVVWDIGSGSGSVAFAASALAWAGWVCAVERQERRSAMIRENRRALGALNVDILTTHAPLGLESLPNPDAIFLGGGLGGNSHDETKTHEFLQILMHRLKPGGRMVTACTLLASLERVRTFASAQKYPAEILMVQAAESVLLAQDVRLVGHNPVFLVRLTKPATRS